MCATSSLLLLLLRDTYTMCNVVIYYNRSCEILVNCLRLTHDIKLETRVYEPCNVARYWVEIIDII